MIFKVPEDFKGSFVLNSVRKILVANSTVSITGGKLLNVDVKSAIKKGHLVPVEKDAYDQYMKISPQAMLVNKTGKVLVVGENILRAWGSLIVDKEVLELTTIQDALKEGIIAVVSDENKVGADQDSTPKEELNEKVSKKDITLKDEEQNKYEQDDEDQDVEEDYFFEEKKVKPVVWDFTQQQMKEAQKVPKSTDMLKVETDSSKDDEVKFVDSKEDSPKKDKKENINAVKKEEKIEKSSKNNKVKKNIEPVGKKREEKTALDAIDGLDSNGNPLEEASDQLQHLIDYIENDDISFVDAEHTNEKLREKRKEK